MSSRRNRSGLYLELYCWKIWLFKFWNLILIFILILVYKTHRIPKGWRGVTPQSGKGEESERNRNSLVTSRCFSSWTSINHSCKSSLRLLLLTYRTVLLQKVIHPNGGQRSYTRLLALMHFRFSPSTKKLRKVRNVCASIPAFLLRQDTLMGLPIYLYGLLF